MLKGRWLILVAIGGLAHADDASVVLFNDTVLVCDETGCRERSNQQENRTNEAQPHNSRATKEGGAPPQIIFESFRPDSPAPQSPSEDEIQREKDDLKAQQDMANWALGMLVATAIGVGLIGLTLRETRRAAKFAADTLRETTRLGNLQLDEAKNATGAAIKTTGVTIEMGKAQSRAYLSISDAYFRFETSPVYPVLKLVVRNSGQTPAELVSLVIGARYGDEPLTDGDRRVVQQYDFGAGEEREIEIKIDWAELADGYFQQWIDGDSMPAFEGWIAYKDVFRSARKNKFEFWAYYSDFDADWNYSPLAIPLFRPPFEI